jgi:hypothetical protein
MSSFACCYRRDGGGGDRGGRGHADSQVSGASRGGFDACQKIEELRRKKAPTAGDNNGFPAFSARLFATYFSQRNSSL